MRRTSRSIVHYQVHTFPPQCRCMLLLHNKINKSITVCVYVKVSNKFMDNKRLLSTWYNVFHLIYVVLVPRLPYNIGKVSIRQDMCIRRTGFY